ncbi:MAG: bifunctional 5,10-methylenetetrahydrofolate dehydrogenase/5,10-methenyltetrahydrofolate cyclohydrolase [Bacillota bacterium]
MMVLKGAEVAASMKEELIREVEEQKLKGISPMLGIVRVGARSDDLAYERGAIKRFADVGIGTKVFEYPETISQEEFIEGFSSINADPSIHGILLFRPLPKHLDEEAVRSLINPLKDIDCMSPINASKVFCGDETGFAPCTPEAVMQLLKHYNINVGGKRVVVLGRSLVVGKPLLMLLLGQNATVTVCHSKTANLKQVCSEAEILISAMGRAKMVTKDYIGKDAVVVDVGINVDNEGKLCGDVDFDSASENASMITPVPGGVGAVTTFILARHVVRSAAYLTAQK